MKVGAGGQVKLHETQEDEMKAWHAKAGMQEEKVENYVSDLITDRPRVPRLIC